MKRRRITASGTTPAEPEANLASPLLDRIELVGCTPVYSAWLAMLPSPVTVMFGRHPIKEITATALFGAVIGAVPAAVLHGVERACWWASKVIHRYTAYPNTTRFSRLAGKNSRIEASASG